MRLGNVETLREVAEVAGVTPKTVGEWILKPDFPKDDDGTYPLFDIGLWRQRQLTDRQPKPRQPSADEDPLLANGDSPGLERYRMAKAQLAEMDLAEREGKTLLVEAVRAGMAAICLPLRGTFEEIQRRFGPDALKVLNDALTTAERKINDQFPEPDDDEPVAAD